jgi:hypothetical protein
MLERPFSSRKSRREGILWPWEILPENRQQGNVVLALARVFWVLPVDWTLVSTWFYEMANMRTYCRYHRSRIVAPSLAQTGRTAPAWKGPKPLPQMARSLYHHLLPRALLSALCTFSSTMQMSSDTLGFQEHRRRQTLRFGHPPIRH